MIVLRFCNNDQQEVLINLSDLVDNETQEIQKLATELIATGSSTYPVIGVQLDMTYEGQGARVEAIVEGGPASETELSAGDVITEIDGVKVSDGTELVVRIRAKNPGEVVELTLEDGSVIEVTLGSDQN
jgi:putative serine protease PepD